MPTKIQLKYEIPIGTVFGKLTVLKYLNATNDRKGVWQCRCVCGSIIEANPQRLRNGRIVNCGSIRCTLKRDIVGERFGRLLVQNDFYYKQMKSGNRILNRSYVKVICDCGNEKYVLTTALLGGDTTSSGCYKKQRINETYGPYREEKGFRADEYITPIIRLERATAKALGINKKILHRDCYKCQICLCKNTISNTLEVHHIIPISECLENHAEQDNLITLCSNCHRQHAHKGCTKDLDSTYQHIFQAQLKYSF